MKVIDLSKQEALDFDLKAIQKINFTRDPDKIFVIIMIYTTAWAIRPAI